MSRLEVETEVRIFVVSQDGLSLSQAARYRLCEMFVVYGGGGGEHEILRFIWKRPPLLKPPHTYRIWLNGICW